MAQKLYEETNIQAIANALRRKLGNTTRETATVQAFTVKTSGATGHDSIGTLAEKYENTLPISFTNAQKVVVIVSCKNVTSTTNLLYFAPGNCTGSFPYDGENTVHISEDITKQIITFENTNTITLHASIYANTTKETGFYAQIVGYDADGNSIQETFTTETEVEQEVPNTFKTSEMAAAVDSISGDSTVEATLVTKTITANGTYNASTSDNADGYSSVTVSVPDYVPNLQSKEVTITANGTQNIAVDDGYDGLSAASVTVDVAPNLQSKTISVTENGAQTVSADASYDGLSNVVLTVNVPTSGGGSSLLDNYGVAFTTYAGLFGKTYYEMSTKRFGGGSGYYVWYVSDSVSVGDNVLDHLISKSASNTNYAYMGFLGLTQSNTTPTLDQMKKCGSINGDDLVFYKYTSVSYTSNIDLGNLVICNGNGIVLFNGTWASAIEALNNKTIDLSNGIFFLSTTCKTSSTGKYNTITFN